jgi:hypothetical protein
VTGGGEKGIRNLARSVHQRLLNRARANHEEAQAVFTRYGKEHWWMAMRSLPSFRRTSMRSRYGARVETWRGGNGFGPRTY